jgi:hypothetical protein
MELGESRLKMTAQTAGKTPAVVRLSLTGAIAVY